MGWDLQMPPTIDSQGIDFVLSKAHSEIGCVSLVPNLMKVIFSHAGGHQQTVGWGTSGSRGNIHGFSILNWSWGTPPPPSLDYGPTWTPCHGQAQKVKLTRFNTLLIGLACLLGSFKEC